MTDYGITVSQEGIDLSEATDAQKTLDSRWRYMEIAKEETVSMGDTTLTGRINRFRHDMGFIPAFDAYNLTTNTYMDFLYADDTWVFTNGGDFWGDFKNTTALIRIYNIPIIEEYSAPIAQTLTKGKSTASRYGLKIINPKKSGELKDNEMTSFSLNTGTKGLAVHKTGTAVANSSVTYGLTIYHGLGNPPIFMLAKCASDKSYVYSITTDAMAEMGKADTTTQMSFRGAQAALSGRYAYIIFKEFADFAV